MFRKTQEYDGKTPPELEAEATPNEIEEPTAEAPTPRQRQRQTTPKKLHGRRSQKGKAALPGVR